MKKIFLILILSSLVLIVGCMPLQNLNEDSTSSVIIGKLVSDDGKNNFVESAGYYEGNIVLKDVITGKDYSTFVCSQKRNWSKEGDCYEFNLEDVQENIDLHKYSAELSGCYIGEFKQIKC